jgi:hypothetical protein
MRRLHTNHGNTDLLEQLNRHGVRYLVIGGLGVHFHDESRAADDLDLLIEATPENAEKLFKAMGALAVVLNFGPENISSPGERHLPLKAAQNGRFYADLLTSELPIDFDAELSGLRSLVNRNEVSIASRDLLIQLKSRSDREKDISDVQLLKRSRASPAVK